MYFDTFERKYESLFYRIDFVKETLRKWVTRLSNKLKLLLIYNEIINVKNYLNLFAFYFK